MKELIKGAYDLHVHSAPDVMPRKMDDLEMAQRVIDSGMAGYALKSHYFCTGERAQLVRKLYPECDAIGAVTLNGSVGGINPTAVEMAARAGSKIVWFPTCDSAHEQKHTFSGDPNKKLPYWAQIVITMKEEGIENPLINILDENGRLCEAAHSVLDVIAKNEMILATSHISHKEAFVLVKAAKEHHVDHIIITHVDFPTTFYTVDEQKEFLKYGAYMEHCYTTFATGKVDFEETLAQIRAIGSEHVVLSTDLGQATAVYPDEGLENFATRLFENGFSEDEVLMMTRELHRPVRHPNRFTAHGLDRAARLMYTAFCMKNSVWKATAAIFFFTLFAKVFAFVKTVLQASVFGASMETDAFNMAQGFVINILLLLTTAIGVSFIPLYIRHKTGSKEEGRRFASVTFTALSILIIFVTIAAVILAPVIVSVIAPTYQGTSRDITILYFRIIAVSLVFNLGYELYLNLLNAEKIFGYTAFASMVNSVVVITAVLLFGARYGVITLVVAVPASYLAQWLLLYMRGRRFAGYTLKYGLRDRDLMILAMQAFPIMLSQTAVDINQVVDRALLSLIGTGVVTAVSYSMVLYRSCCMLISLPVSTVMFTELSEAGAERDGERIRGILESGCRVLVFASIPVMAAVFSTAFDIVSVIYGHGSFTAEAVSRCAMGLRMYILCLLPVCVKDLLYRAYYSVGRTRRAMVFGIIEVIVNITLSVLLVGRFGIYGVVGATAIASAAILVVMLFDYNGNFTRILTRDTLFEYRRVLIAGAASVISAGALSGAFFVNTFCDLVLKAALTFGVYGATVLILRDPLAVGVLSGGIDFVKRRLS